ncbi:MAG: type II toxin-antitoxin system RelE/ParE family toxin [Candidatus Saccharibacteria bacterium]|nr:type II toxin-antitoxin system RelE/ParE family toxin [Candidatus Saccharibacteria bacterium]
MALYKVEINKKVRKKDLPSISLKDVRRIIERIQKLANDPYPVDAVRLKGRDEWRIRQGDYRVLYIVEEKIVTVFVVKIGHRREVYKA